MFLIANLELMPDRNPINAKTDWDFGAPLESLICEINVDFLELFLESVNTVK